MQKQIEHFLRDIGLPYYVWNISIILSAIILWLIIKFIRVFLLRKKRDSDESYSLYRSVVKYIGVPLNYFVPVLMLNILVPVMRIQRALREYVDKTLEVILIITVTWLLVNLVNLAHNYILYKYNFEKPNNLRERKLRTQLLFAKQFLIGVILFVAVAIIFLSFDRLRAVGAGLLTGVGISGIIVGFAAQKSLGNILAGVQIAFTQPIRIDDILTIENEWGRVEEITLTYVVVRIWDERRLILPINYFIEKPFQNWTRNSSELLGTVFIHADYTIPVDAVRQELTRLVTGNKLWDGKTCTLVVTSADEKTVQLRALMSAANAGDSFNLRCYVREHLVRFIAEQYPGSLPKSRTS